MYRITYVAGSESHDLYVQEGGVQILVLGGEGIYNYATAERAALDRIIPAEGDGPNAYDWCRIEKIERLS